MSDRDRDCLWIPGGALNTVEKAIDRELPVSALPFYRAPLSFSQVIYSHWRMILIFAIAGITMGGFYALFATRIYQGVVVLEPVSDSSQSGLSGMLGRLGSLASIAGVDIPTASNRVEAVAYLRSKAFVRSFISDQHLLPVLFPRKWDAATGAWRDPTRAPSLEQGVKNFRDRVLSITQDQRTGLVTLTVSWSDRQTVARWANELASRINEDLRMRALNEATLSLHYLDQQLATTNVVEIRQALYKLIESQSRIAMLATVQREYAFRIIDPAVTPDKSSYVRPIPLLSVIAGLLLGAGLGTLVAAIRMNHRRELARG